MGEFSTNRLQAYMPIADLEDKREFTFTDIRGFQVLNTTGHKVGSVKDIFVDPNTLEPCFAFIHYGKLDKLFNSNMKHYLVPWCELVIGDDFVQTRWTEEELTPRTRAEQERNLASHGGPGEPACGMAPGQTGSRLAGGTQSEASFGGAIETSREMSPNRNMTDDLDESEVKTTASSR